MSVTLSFSIEVFMVIPLALALIFAIANGCYEKGAIMAACLQMIEGALCLGGGGARLSAHVTGLHVTGTEVRTLDPPSTLTKAVQ